MRKLTPANTIASTMGTRSIRLYETPTARNASSSLDRASPRNASRMPSKTPIGMPSDRYSGMRLPSIRHTTDTGPPSFITKSNSLSILSSNNSIAATVSVASNGTSISRAR